MEQIGPTHSVSLLMAHDEVHFMLSGFWSAEGMTGFLDEVNAKAAPLMKARRSIRAFGDLMNFVPQDRETSARIRDHLMAAKKYGLDRIAIATKSALVIMQYKRLSAGIDVEFFDTRDAAINWLRAA